MRFTYLVPSNVHPSPADLGAAVSLLKEQANAEPIGKLDVPEGYLCETTEPLAPDITALTGAILHTAG